VRALVGGVRFAETPKQCFQIKINLLTKTVKSRVILDAAFFIAFFGIFLRINGISF